MARPNLLFVFADQMRAEACHYAGNSFVHTPNLDRLAAQSVNFTHAISGFPVCGPWRASMLTGQYPLKHRLFLNDVALPTDRPTFGTELKRAGYRTGYIGKWHLDGPNRAGFTPPGPRRQGFDFWAAGNCTHDYTNSLYFRDTAEPLYWKGYDAIAQTDLALEFIREQNDPFALFVSWGPPHNPYERVPQQYLDRYPPGSVKPRPNCPEPNLNDLRGYYAHVTALDEQVGRLLRTLEETRKLDNTIFVFTSDHGDMLGSHGRFRKQHPWEESINVPFLLRAPMQSRPGPTPTLLNVWDIMPTLLSLMGIAPPETVQGLDLSGAVTGKSFDAPRATLAASICPFSEYVGPGWRAARTQRYTYAKDTGGPWLLYDNQNDPCQLQNLVNQPAHAAVQAELERELAALLAKFEDDFQPAETYIKRFGYSVDAKRGVPYFSRVGE